MMHYRNVVRDSEAEMSSWETRGSLRPFHSLLQAVAYQSPGGNVSKRKVLSPGLEVHLQREQSQMTRPHPTLVRFSYPDGESDWRQTVAPRNKVVEPGFMAASLHRSRQIRPSQVKSPAKFECDLMENAVPQVLPRYVVRCSMKYGRQRYGANLKLLGKQIRIGSKYTDTISASKVASSAKRFLRRDDVTHELYIEPSPPLSRLTCSVFCSRSSNEMKEVLVSSLLHGFVRAHNSKIAHKRFSNSRVLPANLEKHRKIKTSKPKMPQVEFLEPDVSSLRGQSTGLSQALKRGRVENTYRGGLESDLSSSSYDSKSSEQSDRHSEWIRPERAQQSKSQQFSKKQRTSPGPETICISSDSGVDPIASDSTAHKAGLISQHLSKIYNQVELADKLLTESLHNAPNLSLLSQEFAFASLSSLRSARLLLSPGTDLAAYSRK